MNVLPSLTAQLGQAGGDGKLPGLRSYLSR
jgi:hypothetical protein